MNLKSFSVNSKENLSMSQRTLIENSCKDSFPKVKLLFKLNQIKIKNCEVKNFSEIKSAIERLIFVSKRVENSEAIFRQIKKIRFNKDPIKILEKKGEVKRISNKLFQFQGNFLKVFRKSNEYFYNLAIKKYKAIDQENPMLWPVDLYKKINYLNEFPQQSLMMVGLKQNYKNLKKFSLQHKNSNNFKKIKVRNQFEDVEYGLQPAVCDNCYYSLSNIKNFSNTIYTTYNKVFRNETSTHKNLDRLISFSVRDIMFVGDEKFVIKTRKRLIKEIVKFLKITELDCSLETANDPFFMGNIDKKLFQNSFDLKQEILAFIPFLKKKIAVGSINFHLDTFGKAFNINNKKKKIFSGCIGIGFERLLLALYSQHGVNIKNWPNKLKRELNLK